MLISKDILGQALLSLGNDQPQKVEGAVSKLGCLLKTVLFCLACGAKVEFSSARCVARSYGDGSTCTRPDLCGDVRRLVLPHPCYSLRSFHLFENRDEHEDLFYMWNNVLFALKNDACLKTNFLLVLQKKATLLGCFHVRQFGFVGLISPNASA